jgi:hypothetical protein
LSSRLLSKNVKIKIYRTIILPVVLYGCETWVSDIKEEHGLKVIENRVLRRIFGLVRDDILGGWRKLLNEELDTLYLSPNIVIMTKSRKISLTGQVARMGERRNACRILVGSQ